MQYYAHAPLKFRRNAKCQKYKKKMVKKMIHNNPSASSPSANNRALNAFESWNPNISSPITSSPTSAAGSPPPSTGIRSARSSAALSRCEVAAAAASCSALPSSSALNDPAARPARLGVRGNKPSRLILMLDIYKVFFCSAAVARLVFFFASIGYEDMCSGYVCVIC